MTSTPDAILEDVDIVNRALARIGAPPVMALDDDDDFARAAQLIYLTDVEAALGRLRWRFASRTLPLSRLSAAPVSGWRHAYELPGGALGLPEHYLTDPRQPRNHLRNFSIEAGEVHCDADRLFARCTVMVAPTYWPPEFRRAIIIGLASAFCVPVTHDVTLAEKLRQEAYGDPREGGVGGLLGRAIANEIASSPPSDDMDESNPLTDARYGGWGF
ncbi:hypothetical protein [Bosea sp. (in: a-proteobacteria)]|uniref:hypothetical protein n=1 Tax=Bosea sp. (in: a-proteobacteria) TaxID=1871050 RepID=UPI0026103106|nr:hypothetical protein [Bosea sp. (in: a-proteobacteria)]MCO5091994.1 hypothetical protein [Bosea sp. (in: a-proteobacteria)]